jgi:hypothetical protein
LLALKYQVLISNRSPPRSKSRHARSGSARADRAVREPEPYCAACRGHQAVHAVENPQVVGGSQVHPRLFFSSSHRREPGAKGPSAEVSAAIVGMKWRNPCFGCVRIAQQISCALGLQIENDVVGH